MRANILITFSLLFLVGSPSVPSGLWRRGLILCHIGDVRGLPHFPGGCSACLETEVRFEPRSSWLQILSSRSLKLYVLSTILHGSHQMKPVEKFSLRFLSLHGEWADSVVLLLFFFNSRSVPHSFIKTGRNACRVQSNVVGTGLILSREREAVEEIDPRIRSQIQRQRYSKEVPAVFMFIFLFFLFFPFGCAILNAESYFPNQESNLCPLHWRLCVLTTGPPGKSLFIFIANIIDIHWRKLEQRRKA